MTPPRQAFAPDSNPIRRRLTSLIDALRAAESAMPLSDRDLRMWQTVVPSMTKGLPEDEAVRMRSMFFNELERLAVAARAGNHAS